MNGPNGPNGPLKEDKKIEYRIRKYQRALSIIQRTDYMAGDVMPGQALGGETVKREHILEYANRIIDLKKRLYELTGRCSPEAPKWPV